MLVEHPGSLMPNVEITALRVEVVALHGGTVDLPSILRVAEGFEHQPLRLYIDSLHLIIEALFLKP